MTFVYIEGHRCKSDGLNSRCWSNPSFCLGWEQYCFEADNKFSLCNNQELDPIIPYYKSSSLIDSSKLLWSEPNIMQVVAYNRTETEIIETDQSLYEWECLDPPNQEESQNVTDVLCTALRPKYWIYTHIIDKGGNVKLLKTAAGQVIQVALLYV